VRRRCRESGRARWGGRPAGTIIDRQTKPCGAEGSWQTVAAGRFGMLFQLRSGGRGESEAESICSEGGSRQEGVLPHRKLLQVRLGSVAAPPRLLPVGRGPNLAKAPGGQHRRIVSIRCALHSSGPVVCTRAPACGDPVVHLRSSGERGLGSEFSNVLDLVVKYLVFHSLIKKPGFKHGSFMTEIQEVQGESYTMVPVRRVVAPLCLAVAVLDGVAAFQTPSVLPLAGPARASISSVRKSSLGLRMGAQSLPPPPSGSRHVALLRCRGKFVGKAL